MAQNMSIPDVTEHIRMERDTLRLLCSVLIKPVTRVEICRMLGATNFFEPLQRVVFEEICALGPVDSKDLLQLLPACVSNRGLANFNLDELLTPDLATEADIEALFQSALQLIALNEIEPPTLLN